jgi:DNA-binding transcriptional regulator YdaS (Cro superfamily)
MELNPYLSEEHGRGARLAAALNVSTVLVSQWKNGKQIPDDRCQPIEYETGGQVTCEEMRPDLPWLRIKDPAWPNPAGRPLLDHATTQSAA